LIAKLKELGLLSSDNATLRGSILDTLCARLEQECPLEPGMADLVLLRHTFKVEWADGKKVRGPYVSVPC
jgi:saccharopine dehydrogenase-like NADP-dependent oxidoreductase